MQSTLAPNEKKRKKRKRKRKEEKKEKESKGNKMVTKNDTITSLTATDLHLRVVSDNLDRTLV
jgi:hypothetical protein